MADDQMSIEQIIKKRRSSRVISSRPVPREVLIKLFESARWASSSYNEQPWRFVVATKDDAEGYARMLDCLVEQNRRWAQTAPVLMLAVARRGFAVNDKSNAHAWYDVGQAMATFALQATAENLTVHQMAGFDSNKAREEFSIPAEYEPVAMAAVGYEEAPENLSAEAREKENAPRTRKPLGEIVFADQFGRPAPLIAGAEKL